MKATATLSLLWIKFSQEKGTRRQCGRHIWLHIHNHSPAVPTPFPILKDKLIPIDEFACACALGTLISVFSTMDLNGSLYLENLNKNSPVLLADAGVDSLDRHSASRGSNV